MPFIQGQPPVLQCGGGIGRPFEMRARIIDEPDQLAVRASRADQKIGRVIEQLRGRPGETLCGIKDRPLLGVRRAQASTSPIIDGISAALTIIGREKQVEPGADAGVRRRRGQIVDGQLQRRPIRFNVGGQFAGALAHRYSKQGFLFQIRGLDSLQRCDKGDKPERQQGKRQDQEHLDAGGAENRSGQRLGCRRMAAPDHDALSPVCLKDPAFQRECLPQRRAGRPCAAPATLGLPPCGFFRCALARLGDHPGRAPCR